MTTDWILMKLLPLDSYWRDESNGNCFISNGLILTELFTFSFRVKFGSGQVGSGNWSNLTRNFGSGRVRYPNFGSKFGALIPSPFIINLQIMKSSMLAFYIKKKVTWCGLKLIAYYLILKYSLWIKIWTIMFTITHVMINTSPWCVNNIYYNIYNIDKIIITFVIITEYVLRTGWLAGAISNIVYLIQIVNGKW